MYGYFVLIFTVYEDLPKHAAGWSRPRVSQKTTSRRAVELTKYSGSFSRNFDPSRLPTGLHLIWGPYGHVRGNLLVSQDYGEFKFKWEFKEWLKLVRAGVLHGNVSPEEVPWIKATVCVHSFWKLFRIKQVKGKSALYLATGSCLNTHQGKAGKLSVSPDSRLRTIVASLFFF